MAGLVSRSRSVATNAERGHEPVELGRDREGSPTAQYRRRERENHSLAEWQGGHR
jgi:hypothetical protein